MLEKFINKSIERPIATTVLFGAVAILGVFAAFNIPMEIFPSVDFPKLYVSAYWPGAPATMVESEITSIIEAELSSVRGVSQIRSYSQEGLSRIELDLHRGVDVEYVRFVINERLRALLERLPPQVRAPRVSKYVPEGFRKRIFLSYHLVGKIDEADLRDLAIRRIKPALIGIHGIAGVEVVGGRERQVQIVFDEDKMRKWGLFPDDISRAVRNADLLSTVGRMRRADRHFNVTLREFPSSVDDLKMIPIKFVGDRCIRLKDVADVVRGLAPRYSIHRINGKPAVLLRLARDPSTNIIKLAGVVADRINLLNERLPEGVRLIKESDQSLIVKNALHQLLIRSLISFFVVFIVLLLFLRHVRLSLLVQMSIVVSMLFTILVIFVSRYGLNLITMAGIAMGFGFLVDNSIIVVENILRCKSIGGQPGQPELVGAATIVHPVIASTLTTIAALFPFLYLMGELRIYYLPFAVTVSIALAASLMVSFSLTPALTKRFLQGTPFSKTLNQKDNSNERQDLSASVGMGYERALHWCLRYPILVVLLTIWVFGVPFWKLPSKIQENPGGAPVHSWATQLYNSVMANRAMIKARPYLDHILGGSLYLFVKHVNRFDFSRWNEQTYIGCHISLPSGSPIEEVDKVSRLMEGAILNIEGAYRIYTDVYPGHSFITVLFKDGGQKGIEPFIVKNKMISVAKDVGNARISVVGYGPGFQSQSEAFFLQNAMVLTGYNYPELRRYLEGIVQRLEENRRVKNVRTDLSFRFYQPGILEHTIKLRRDRMSVWKVSSRDVIRQINPYFSQYIYSQRIRIGDEELPYAVHSKKYDGFQMFQLRNLVLRNRLGQKIPFRSISETMEEQAPPVIERKNQEYYRLMTFDYLGSIRRANKFIDDFIKSVKLPSGYAIEKASDFSWQNETAKNMALVVVLSLLLMYMVLSGLYESFTYPLVVFLAIPLSLIGVFLIYYLTGVTFGRSAFIGVVLLLGITLNNAIILLDRVNNLRREGKFESYKNLIVRACRDRFRPILMTSLTTVGAMVPLIFISYFHSGRDIWYPLSLSTVGGLLSGTFLGLFFIPAVLVLLTKKDAFMSSSGKTGKE